MNIVEEEIEKIRAVRRKISSEYGNDPRRMVEYFRKVSDKLRASGKFTFAKATTARPHPATANGSRSV